MDTYLCFLFVYVCITRSKTTGRDSLHHAVYYVGPIFASEGGHRDKNSNHTVCSLPAINIPCHPPILAVCCFGCTCSGIIGILPSLSIKILMLVTGDFDLEYACLFCYIFGNSEVYTWIQRSLRTVTNKYYPLPRKEGRFSVFNIHGPRTDGPEVRIDCHFIYSFTNFDRFAQNRF